MVHSLETWGEDSDFSLNDRGGMGFTCNDVHDVGNGRILMFDNGVLDNNGFLSRAVELALDTVNFTAKMRSGLPTQVCIRGSAIRLENGNTLIGWGTAKLANSGPVSRK